VFKFITRRPLWLNILFALFLFFLVVFIFLGSLGFLTKHGKELQIPSVTGKLMAEASDRLYAEGFDVEIQDSVYVDTIPPLTVTRQFPEAGSRVKINRTVYLTVNRVEPPLISMPRLVGSYRTAVLALKQNHLKLGDTIYRPDFAKNSVLGQIYNGQEIRPGAKVPMGATITLILGSGLSNVNMMVPDLFGKTYAEAKAQLDSMGVGLVPVVDPGVSDTMNAFIYKQNPERLNYDRRVNRIRPGQIIDLWLSVEQKERIIDSTNNAQDLISQ
jgi:beta-lactam-binding protein with PASTA domain